MCHLWCCLQIGARRFACSFCPQAFNRRDDKARHERMHTGAKPYACSVCEYVVTTRTALFRMVL